MPEAAEFRIGAVVRCASGQACGKVRYLDIDPHTRTLTHLAVEEKGRQGLGRLVPIGQARSDGHTHEIEFLGPTAEFTKLPASDVTEFAPGTVGYELHGPEQLAGRAVQGISQTETFEQVPAGDVEIPSGDTDSGRDFHIHAGSHEFGRVHGVLVDGDARVTHVLLGEWHGLRHVEVAVPFAEGDTVEADGFHFGLSKHEMQALPPYDADSPGGDG